MKKFWIKHKEKVILGAILLLAFLLRAWGANFGLPNFFVHTDESLFFSKGIYFFNPHLRPPEPVVTIFHLFIFIQYKVYLFLREFVGGYMPLAAQAKSEFFLLARMISVLFSTASIFLVYILAKKIFQENKGKIALLSSLFLTVNFIDILIGHYLKEDVYIQFVGLLILLLVFSVKKRQTLTWFLVGFFSAIKMSGLIFIVPSLLIFRTQIRKFSLKKAIQLLSLVALVIFGFIAGHPLALLEKNYFISYWKFLTVESINLPGVDTSNGVSSFLWWIQYLSLSGLYWPFFFSFILGFLLLIKDLPKFEKTTKERVLSIMILSGLYLLLLFIRPNRYDRYITLITPLLAMFAAYFLVKLLESIRGKFSKTASFIFQTLILLFVFTPSIIRGAAFDFEIAKKDTREQAAEWIKENIPEDQAVFTVGDTMHIGHYLQKNGFYNVVNDFPLNNENIFRFPGEIVVIDSANYHKAKNYQTEEQNGKFWKNYQLLREKGELIKEYSNSLFRSGFFSPAFLEHSSTVNAYHNPTVEIYKIPKLDDYYKQEINFEYLPEKMGSNMQLVDKDSQKMLYSDGGKEAGISGPYEVFPSGGYVLKYFLKDVKCYSPKALFTLRVTSGGGAREFAKKDFLCSQVVGHTQLNLTLQLKKSSTLELIIRSRKGISFWVEKATLMRTGLIN